MVVLQAGTITCYSQPAVAILDSRLCSPAPFLKHVVDVETTTRKIPFIMWDNFDLGRSSVDGRDLEPQTEENSWPLRRESGSEVTQIQASLPTSPSLK